jgi:hypothetical protein
VEVRRRTPGDDAVWVRGYGAFERAPVVYEPAAPEREFDRGHVVDRPERVGVGSGARDKERELDRSVKTLRSTIKRLFRNIRHKRRQRAIDKALETNRKKVRFRHALLAYMLLLACITSAYGSGRFAGYHPLYSEMPNGTDI